MSQNLGAHLSSAQTPLHLLQHTSNLTHKSSVHPQPQQCRGLQPGPRAHRACSRQQAQQVQYPRPDLPQQYEPSTPSPTAPAPTNGSFSSSLPAEARVPQPFSPAAPQQDLQALKLALLQRAAALDRGALAGPLQRLEVEGLVQQLEQAGTSQRPLQGSPSAVEGRWELVFASVEPFRSSPFFWAFQEGLVQDRRVAAAIFKLTDSVPGAVVGTAMQTISLSQGELLSEVDLTVFPGLTGTVVTSCRISPSTAEGGLGQDLDLEVSQTCVRNSNLLPALFDQLAVNVSWVFQRLRGAGASRVAVRMSFVDQDLRVARTLPDNQFFVYRRM